MIGPCTSNQTRKGWQALGETIFSPRIREGLSSPGMIMRGFWMSSGTAGSPRSHGRAGSARPQGRHHANPSAPPFGHRPFRPPTRNHDMPRLASGLATRTHGVRPSEKTAFRVISGPSRKAISPPPRPPRRGGLRTPAREASRQPQHCPLWGHRPLANSCLIMTPSVYVQPCQTDAQSASLREKRLSRHLGPFPARRPALGLASPRRGGLPTPAREA